MTVDQTWLAQQFPELMGITPLNNGGQKWVFSADHPDEGNIVLKLIQPNQDIERVNREALAAQQVSPTRVPKIHQMGTITSQVGNIVWIREQRISGRSAREAIAAGRFSLETLLRLGRDILEVLVIAERERIVHRDVKPDNIIIDPDGRAWLLDFGLARHLDLTSLTATAAIFGMGTPGYAPPEQFRNRKDDIDQRADMFGLGVTMYEAATGVNPFTDQTRDFLEILRRVERLNPPRLSNVMVPQDVSEFIATLMHTHRDHRPQTTEEALTWVNELCDSYNVI